MNVTPVQADLASKRRAWLAGRLLAGAVYTLQSVLAREITAVVQYHYFQ